MLSLIRKYYKGKDAARYELARSNNPKWAFEDDVLRKTLESLKNEVKTVLDMPVGTGRALDILTSYDSLTIEAADLSEDMMAEAKKRDVRNRVKFRQMDMLAPALDVKADLVVCYRFLNLIDWPAASTAVRNLAAAAEKYLLFTIRTVPRSYTGELYIEDKLHLHYDDDLERALTENGLKIANRYLFDDKREGQYQVWLCSRTATGVSSRINKNYRVTYSLPQDPEQGTVKAYEVHDQTHAEFIGKVVTDGTLAKWFPGVIRTEGNFVFAPWIEGALLQADQWHQVANLLVKIQNTKVDWEPSFDYFEHLLVPRFSKLLPVAGGEFINSTIETTRRESMHFERRLSHPDLVPGNVIQTKDGIKVIDNELLTVSRHHRVDLLNMLSNLPENRRTSTLDHLLEGLQINHEQLRSEGKYLQALWVIRQSGSKLVSGRTEEAFTLIEKYRKGINILPIDL